MLKSKMVSEPVHNYFFIDCMPDDIEDIKNKKRWWVRGGTRILTIIKSVAIRKTKGKHNYFNV